MIKFCLFTNFKKSLLLQYWVNLRTTKKVQRTRRNFFFLKSNIQLAGFLTAVLLFKFFAYCKDIYKVPLNIVSTKLIWEHWWTSAYINSLFSSVEKCRSFWKTFQRRNPKADPLGQPLVVVYQPLDAFWLILTLFFLSLKHDRIKASE